MWAEAVYGRSPIFVQNWMLSLKGSQFHRERYGNETFRHAEQRLRENESLSIEELQALQLAELRIFTAHCYCKSPYYRGAFERGGVRPEQLNALQDLQRFPITPKQDLRARTREFYAAPISRKLIEVHTSGTTGSPLTVYFSPEDVAWRYAFLDRCRRWAGVSVGQRRASFSGRIIVPPRQHKPPFWRLNRPGKQLLFSSYHLLPENLPEYAKALVAFDPEILDGYPSSVHILADYMLHSGTALRIRPQAVFLTAETVLPHQRAAIEEAFQCHVYNQYASSDGAPFISECSQGRLHVHLDSGVIEFVQPDGTPARPGEPGEMVVTSFTTHVTPLFRLAIGDIAVPSANGERCECGLAFPVVETVLGRVEDILFTPDRGYVGRMDTTFKALPNSVVEAQIVQTAPDRIVLRLVPDESRYRPEHAEKIVSEMRKRLGDVVHIEVQLLKAVPRGASGKMRAVVNECASLLPRHLRYAEVPVSPQP